VRVGPSSPSDFALLAVGASTSHSPGRFASRIPSARWQLQVPVEQASDAVAAAIEDMGGVRSPKVVWPNAGGSADVLAIRSPEETTKIGFWTGLGVVVNHENRVLDRPGRGLKPQKPGPGPA
jgi:hypothetical protein